MSYTKIWIHAVWGTKNRLPFLTKEIKQQVITHIRENAKSKNIHINRINGYTDHLHALISLNADMSLSKTMQLIKGESAYWINKNNLTRYKFEWANEYYAASIGENDFDRVKAYIDGQEAHHAKHTFKEEYNKFMTDYLIPSQG